MLQLRGACEEDEQSRGLPALWHLSEGLSPDQVDGGAALSSHRLRSLKWLLILDWSTPFSHHYDNCSQNMNKQKNSILFPPLIRITMLFFKLPNILFNYSLAPPTDACIHSRALFSLRLQSSSPLFSLLKLRLPIFHDPILYPFVRSSNPCTGLPTNGLPMSSELKIKRGSASF